MTFLLIFLLIFFILSLPSVRAWLVMKFLGSVQRRMQRQMQEQMHSQGRYQQRANKQSAQAGEPHRRDKVDIQQVEARKFERDGDDEYVDFEELPK